METVTLNDGTVLNGHCIQSGKKLYVYLDRMSVIDGVTIFADPKKLETITELNHGVEHIYKGYTQLNAVSSDFGNCNIVLGRPGDA